MRMSGGAKGSSVCEVLRQLSGPFVEVVLEEPGVLRRDPGDDHGREAPLFRLLGDQVMEKALALLLDVGGVPDLSRGGNGVSTQT